MSFLAKVGLLSACLILGVVAAHLSVIQKDYCVIGAGPAGLQMGYFLNKAGRDYAILERSSRPGSFYTRFPRHGKLISINKRFADSDNSEFCLRHDWNSLLSDDPSLLYKHYSQDMFPARETMLTYLKDFQEKLGIKVDFNTEVANMTKSQDGRFYVVTNQKNYSCHAVIVATGLANHKRFVGPGAEYLMNYDTMSVNQSDFENKMVLIIGKGNSGFETANHLYGHTRVVHMASRHTVRLSWSTHYVGDIRGVNNELLDSYQLKSLDGLFELQDGWKVIKRNDGKLSVVHASDDESVSPHAGSGHSRLTNSNSAAFDTGKDFNPSHSQKFSYDTIINACGFLWNSSITESLGVSSTANRKYPLISHQYESSEVENLFFAGTMTHSLDYRKAAGGFIHGFRYTTQALHRYLENRMHGVPWPARKGPFGALVDTLVKRINEGSGNYQMFSVLGDVIIIDRENGTFKLLPEIPIQTLHILPSLTGHKVPSDVFVFIFEYGEGFSGPVKDVFYDGRTDCDSSNAHRCNFLHPVIYHYSSLPTVEAMKTSRGKKALPKPSRLLHLKEDFFTDFRSRSHHIIPLVAFLEDSLGIPLYPLSQEHCTSLLLMHSDVGSYCSQSEQSWSYNDMMQHSDAATSDLDFD